MVSLGRLWYVDNTNEVPFKVMAIAGEGEDESKDFLFVMHVDKITLHDNGWVAVDSMGITSFIPPNVCIYGDDIGVNDEREEE